jgi:urease accessory protein
MTHSFLAALQLADSFFPSGLYTQSHGLESFVAAGVAGPEGIEPLLHAYLLHAAGPGDALAARWANRATAADDMALVAQVDTRLDATKLSSETRSASRRCGGRVLPLGERLYGDERLRSYAGRVAAGEAPGHQSVALALLAAAAGLDEEAAVLVELHTFAVSLVSAAVRLGALDHLAAQALLLRAGPAIERAAWGNAETDWREIGGFAPRIDLAQFRHRYAETHMFAS